MATSVMFNGKIESLPGSYGEIKSGVQNQSPPTSYGRLLIIDTGLGAGFGGGSGVAGTLKEKKDSIYSFDNIIDFQNFVKGSKWWHLAEPLFRPNGFNGVGVSQIDIIRACATVPAEVVLTFGPDSSSVSGGIPADGGTMTIQCADEGVIGNGLLTGLVLYKGFAVKMVRGEADNTKYALEFWVGSWKGLHSDGYAYDFIEQADSEVKLYITSDEFDNFDDLVAWMKRDVTFGAKFKLKSYTKNGTGGIDDSDLNTYSDYTLFTGGAETYNTTHLESVLDAILELPYNATLCNDFGLNAMSANNGKILSHILTEAKYRKYMYVGGGKDRNEFNTPTGSVGIAEYYNTGRCIVVHGASKKTSVNLATGFREETDSQYQAAAAVGRILGFSPQIPATFKPIAVDGEVHDLTEKEKKLALKKGILVVTLDDDGQYCILQDVNTLQKNSNFINEDGQSHSIQVERISSIVDTTLIVNSKKDLLKRDDGVNRFTLSDKLLRDWTINQLKAMSITETEDNYLLSFQNVTVVTVSDTKRVNYGFTPNSEITKLFFTGTILS